MTCCEGKGVCTGVNGMFNERKARMEYRRYLKKGARGMTAKLIAALKRENLEGMSLIDIGGGVGAIHHELIIAGVGKATDVDGSEAYIQRSEEEGRRLGHEARVSHRFGDYVEQADALGEADIVTLDKVICCYRDMKELVGKSAAKAKVFYGIIYPLDRWWVRWIAAIGNILVKFRSAEFRGYVHREAEVEAVITGFGFKRRFYYKNMIWQTALYEK